MYVCIALAFGLAIMALIQMIGHVSGGHINPAVTIAMAVAMKISIVRAFLYVTAQILGAIVGGFILKGLTPSHFHDNLAVTRLGNDVTQAQGFGIELILTFVLVTVIFGTTDPHRASFGSPSLLIGLTVTVGHLAGINYTGSSMNPSRSLGSAIASDSWDDHWIYWIAPIAGGLLSAAVYKFILDPYRGVINMDEAITKLKSDAPAQQFDDINMKTIE
ncbi:Aquaporin [Plakobranchus ocellatus]|uniref:Aquaporin n=1 Tax=Plakobranchus ocellatus TaxID=259542 RepID=A0AAV4BQK7_9GAST|nr:Aquaporin [Plakobranchus ocellatus]